jgi:hypothetical protein
MLVGATLYNVYHQRIRRIAQEYGKPMAAACGAFAALSPQSPIASNFRSLVTCMWAEREGLAPGDITVSTYHRGKVAAMRLLAGEVEFNDICSGPKITAFRHNLLFRGQSDRVTIDGHMVGIMRDKDLKMSEALFHERRKGGTDHSSVSDAGAVVHALVASASRRQEAATMFCAGDPVALEGEAGQGLGEHGA